MLIAKCRPYHARTVGQSVIHMPDGKSVFKIYYLSVIGRDKPELFEWEYAPQTMEEFEKVFLSSGIEGIGYVTAFPHITKVFRFSPVAETVVDVSEFNTPTMSPKDCSRGDGTHEFACYAEAAIACEEFDAWAEASSVKEYLTFRCTRIDYPILNHEKLAAYW